MFVAPSVCYALDPSTHTYTLPIGWGLFAARNFAVGEVLAEFVGEVVTPSTAERRVLDGFGGYMVALSQRRTLDCYAAAMAGSCLASFANSALHLLNTATRSPANNNARLCVGWVSRTGTAARLRATRPIPMTSEILFPYSPAFRYPAPQPVSPPLPAMPDRPAPSTVPPTQPYVPAGPDPPRIADRSRPRERNRVSTLPVLTTAVRDAELARTTADVTSRCLRLLFGGSTIDEDTVLRYLHEAHVAAADTHGMLQAVQWGEHLQFPAHLLERDERDFHECGDMLANLTAQRRLAALPDSLSLSRVQACFGVDGSRVPGLDPVDFLRLCSIAEQGVVVPLPARFIPVASPAPLRRRYVEVQGAIHRLLLKQVEAGTVVLLPLHLAQRCHGIHLLNAQHWTTKKGKPQGRSIADLSNVPDPVLHCPVNGHFADERAVLAGLFHTHFGPISHPTLTQLMNMVADQADLHGWDNITLWKLDLQGAFNLMWFHPEAVPLMAFLLVHDIVAIHLVGLFGWAGMPFAFQVLTRALQALVSAVIAGQALWYVDDCMGCSPATKVDLDVHAAQAAITALAGPHAVAPDKTERGLSLEFIGWQVCLRQRSVSVSPRNLLKATHAFFSFSLADRISGVHIERMSSLASRISVLCRYLRPFTRHLALAAAQAEASPAHLRRLSAKARCEVVIWRAFLILLRCGAPAATRPILSFRAVPPTFALHYDASLQALAVGVYSTATAPDALLAFTVLPLPFAISGDSSRQNTCEYLAVLLGLLLLAVLQQSDFSYALYGDSVTSLVWASADRAASDVAHRANLALVTLSVSLNAHVADTHHVPGVQNVVYDGLSRGRTPQEVGLDPGLFVDLQHDPAVLAFVTLCDPALPLVSVDDVLSLFGVLITHLRSIQRR